MNTGARRSCVTNSSRPQRLTAKGTNGSGAGVAIEGTQPTTRHNSPKKIHVSIAAENRLLREALTRMLGKDTRIEVHGSEWTAAEPLKISPEGEAEILLISSQGNLNEDLDRIQQARTEASKLRILVLGVAGDEKEFLQCVRAGVHGYLPQDASGEEVLRAIEALAAGEAVCRGAHCGVLFRYFEQDSAALPKLGLTRREQQLIPLLARGLTNKEIANHFSLSEQTIKNHVHRMKNKIGAEDRLDIVQLYRVQGFLV
jgi:two-component system, NarL family, response regulator DevR